MPAWAEALALVATALVCFALGRINGYWAGWIAASNQWMKKDR